MQRRPRSLRPRWLRVVVVVVAVVVVAGVVGVVVHNRASSNADGSAHLYTLTMSADAARSGWYPDEAALAPSALNDADFGKLFSTSLDGQVYAQPLVSRGTLLAVTENNSAYGLDPVNGSVVWHHNYGRAFDPSVIGCGDLTPKVGITGTPVIDPDTNIAYFTTKVATAADSSTTAWYLHGVNVATGSEQPHFPVLIHGAASNDPTTTFQAQFQLQRTGLALVDGVVYAGFGGHCDHEPFAGWVAGVSTAGKLTSMWADETGQAGDGEAGIWQSGGAPVVDASGHLYYVSGNGKPPLPGPALGQPAPQGLGQCVFKLNTTTGGKNGVISIADWFCPANAGELNRYDGDFGSGGPAALPASFSGDDGAPLLVIAGKSGVVYVLDMDDLGGRGDGPDGTDRVVAQVGPYGGVWSKPAVWPGDGGYVYLPTAAPAAAQTGTSGSLNVFKRVVDGTGRVSLSLVGRAPSPFGFSSSSPVVTSNGKTPGSAVVWIVHANDSSGAGATLQAYQAVPQNAELQLLWSSPLGSPGVAAKFNPPAVSEGRVYVGTRDGTVVGFGERDGPPKLVANAVAFPPTSLGRVAHATARFTANAAVTIQTVGIENPTSAQNPVFLAGASTPRFPVTLKAGQVLSVPLTFAPAAIGLQTGTLTANTSAGAANLRLGGTGTPPTVPIGTAPSAVDFGTLPIGGRPVHATISFTNNSPGSFAVTGVEAPVGPFTLSGAPATDGSAVVPAGGSIGIDVLYTPPITAGNFQQTFLGQLTLRTDIGDVLVPITGRAAPPAQIVITPTAVRFPSVAAGRAVTRTFTVGNSGGTPLTILKSKPPVANAFGAVSTLAEGAVIRPHASVTETVRFEPAAAGDYTDQWLITGNDDTGLQTVTFTGTAAGPG